MPEWMAHQEEVYYRGFQLGVFVGIIIMIFGFIIWKEIKDHSPDL